MATSAAGSTIGGQGVCVPVHLGLSWEIYAVYMYIYIIILYLQIGTIYIYIYIYICMYVYVYIYIYVFLHSFCHQICSSKPWFSSEACPEANSA